MNYFQIVMCIFLIGCSVFQERNRLKESGVVLGSSIRHVESKLGEAKISFSFHTLDHKLSVWTYNSKKADYQPAYEGDDYGVFAPRSGIREYEEKECRLIFVDGYLCSIEDYIENKVYTVDRSELPDNIPGILDEIRERDVK